MRGVDAFFFFVLSVRYRCRCALFQGTICAHANGFFSRARGEPSSNHVSPHLSMSFRRNWIGRRLQHSPVVFTSPNDRVEPNVSNDASFF